MEPYFGKMLVCIPISHCGLGRRIKEEALGAEHLAVSVVSRDRKLYFCPSKELQCFCIPGLNSIIF